MKKCPYCAGKRIEKKGRMPDGVEYSYLECEKCGEETLDMSQLHEVAKKYREMKIFRAKLSKWGLSLGLRIPKDLVKKYKLKDKDEIKIIPEKEGLKLIPA